MFDHINHWLRTLPEKLRQLPPLQRFALLGVPAALLAALIYWGLGRVQTVPRWLGVMAAIMEGGRFWFLVVLVLPPLAMTMALLWKTKEVILDSIFSAKE